MEEIFIMEEKDKEHIKKMLRYLLEQVENPEIPDLYLLEG